MKPPSNARRLFLKKVSPLALLCLPGTSTWGAATSEPIYPPVLPGRTLLFPRDHGAHPDYRTEWWYLTAWMQSSQGSLGMQITFFRSRTPYGRDNPSRFSPTQLLLAHAALAIPDRGTLLHDQQAWRAGGKVAQYSVQDTDVVVGLPSRRWQMIRNDSDQYRISVRANEFSFDVTATPPPSITDPVLQGIRGYSQKGPAVEQSSYYYSRPQLRIDGIYQTDGPAIPMSGSGWLDHEWSSEMLDENAVGWDWVGLNFHDGSALMAFQMRTSSGDALHSAARHITVKAGNHVERDLVPRFTTLRYWQSPRTDARYPVAVRLQVGELDLTIEPLFDDQELDSRGSTGVIYWEGAVQVWDSHAVNQNGSKNSERIATGYLELTGYAGELVM